MAELGERVSPQDFTPPIEEGVVNNAPAKAFELLGTVVDKMDQDRALDALSAFNKALEPINAGQALYTKELQKLASEVPNAGPALASLAESLQKLKTDETDGFFDPNQAAIMKADLLRSYIARYPRYAQLFQKLGNAETAMGGGSGGGVGGGGGKTGDPALDALEDMQAKAVQAGLTVPEYLSIERQNAQLELDHKVLNYQKDLVEHNTRFAYEYADASFRVVSQQTLTEAFKQIDQNSELFGKMTPDQREAWVNTNFVPVLSMQMQTILRESQLTFGGAFTQAQQQELRMQQNEVEQLMRQVARAEDPGAEIEATLKLAALQGVNAAVKYMPMLRYAGEPKDMVAAMSRAHAYLTNPNNVKLEMLRQDLTTRAAGGDFAARLALEYTKELTDKEGLSSLLAHGIKLGQLPPVPGGDPNVTAHQRDAAQRLMENVKNPEALEKVRMEFLKDMTRDGFKRMTVELDKTYVRKPLLSHDEGRALLKDTESSRQQAMNTLVNFATQGVQFVYPSREDIAIPKNYKWKIEKGAKVLIGPAYPYQSRDQWYAQGYAALGIDEKTSPKIEVPDVGIRDMLFHNDKEEMYNAIEYWNAQYYFLYKINPAEAETFRRQTIERLRVAQKNIVDFTEFEDGESDTIR